jgi:UDP-GlcNAc:undecaprenyl-phosphate GlcNAc-1-phosphate transferase
MTASAGRASLLGNIVLGLAVLVALLGGLVSAGLALRDRPLAAAAAAAVLALLAALAATPLVARAARRQGWLDHPDGRLKQHATAVPRVGGLAVYGALGLGLVAAAHPAWGAGGQGGPLFLAMGAVLLVGLADDLRGVGPPVKLAVEAAAAFGLCAQVGAVRAVSVPWLGPIELGVLAWPLTVIWLIGVSNAFNMIDGLDGLAAGSGCVSASVLALLLLARGDPAAPVAAALGGALLGVLRSNRSPASIFLGGGGSLSIGFALGALALQGAANDAGEVSLALPLLVLALPLADATLAVARRARDWRSLFAADRGHLHHRLLSRLDGQAVVSGLVVLQGAAACFAWFLAVTRPQSKLWALAGTLGALVAGLLQLRPRPAAAEASAPEAAGASRS